jgi:hypothetical protein
VPHLQLNPPLPLTTPRGDGFAHFLIDDGLEHDLYWVVMITETGEIWTFANKYVRGQKNITAGRLQPSEIRAPLPPVSIPYPKEGATA